MKFLSLTLSAIIASSALAQTNNTVGRATYGILSRHWNCEATIKATNGEPISALWNTFGRDVRCLDRLKPSILQVHLINEVCQRNGRCEPHEFLYGISPDAYRSGLGRRDPEILRKLRGYLQEARSGLHGVLTSATQVYVSPGLESNLDGRAARVLLRETARVFPNARIVWNPVNNNRFGNGPIKGYVHELHGSHLKPTAPCISNLDGEDIDLAIRPAILPQFLPEEKIKGYLDRQKHCDVTFLWVSEDNGISSPTFRPPLSRRDFTSARVSRYLSQFIKGEFPKYEPLPRDKSLCQGKIKTLSDGPGGRLFKQSDNLSRGAVFLDELLSQHEYKSVALYRNGSKLESAYYGGLGNPYSGGNARQHWRFRTMATKMPLRIVLKADNQCYYIHNPRKRND